MSGSALDRFRLEGRVAIITGAGKGIGASIARALADAGADCVLTSRTATDIESVAEEVRVRGRRALAIAGDVNDLEGLALLVERTMDEFGHLDIVINNAGGSRSKPILRTLEQERLQLVSKSVKILRCKSASSMRSLKATTVR